MNVKERRNVQGAENNQSQANISMQENKTRSTAVFLQTPNRTVSRNVSQTKVIKILFYFT